MIIVGEKLNTSVKNIKKAVEDRDVAVIKDMAFAQSQAGADYIDVNCGTFVENEPELLSWMVDTVVQHVDTPLCLDSPNHIALKAALKSYKNGKPIINSITGEKERYNNIIPLVLEYNTSIIALCMDDNGIPDTVDGRLAIADIIVNQLAKEGIPFYDIYIDPMIQPVATNHNNSIIALDTIRKIKQELGQVNIICGLSNISYGMPSRKVINKAFLTLAIHSGLDAAIIDPLDKDIISAIYAAELLDGKDEYCFNYIEAYRQGKIL